MIFFSVTELRDQMGTHPRVETDYTALIGFYGLMTSFSTDEYC